MMDNENPVKHPCCDAWAKAHQSGTDNEGYEALVKESGAIGDGLPPVRFCPWCGVAKSNSVSGSLQKCSES